MSCPTVLVTRGTGTQGRSVVRKCLEHGFQVHTIVRDAKEDRAINLERLGATTFEGAIDNQATLEHALRGCTYLFIALMPRFDEDASELRQVRVIIAAALASTPPVRHVVISTALSSPTTDAALHSDLYKKFKEVKLQVENEIKSAGFDTWTVIRPGYFMSNFLWPLGSMMFPQLAKEGKFVSALEKQTKLPLIDPDDIGRFAAAVFTQPERFNGQVLSIASENRTTVEVIAALENASGKSIEATWINTDEAMEMAKTNPMIAGQLLTRSLEHLIDYGQLTQWNVPLETFEAYLKREQRLVRKTFHEVQSEQLNLFEVANK